jgi:hypothetical protein
MYSENSQEMFCFTYYLLYFLLFCIEMQEAVLVVYVL